MKLSEIYFLNSSIRELEKDIEQLKTSITSEEEYLLIYVNLRLENSIDRVLRNKKELELKLQEKELILQRQKAFLQEKEKKLMAQTKIAIYVSKPFYWYKNQLEDLGLELKAITFFNKAENFFRLETSTLYIELREKADLGTIDMKNSLDLVLIDSEIETERKEDILLKKQSKKIIEFNPPSYTQILLNRFLGLPINFNAIYQQIGIRGE